MRDRSASRRPRPASRFDLTPKSMVVVAVAGACVWLLIELLPVVLVIVVALMIVGMVAPIIAWLERKRVFRGLAIAIVFVSMLAMAVLLATLTLPRLLAEVAGLLDRLPQTQSIVAEYLQKNRFSAPLAQSVRTTRIPELVGNGVRAAVSYSPQIIEMVGGAVSAVFLALYLIIDRDRMRGGLFALVPRHFHLRLSRVLLGLETIVGGYMRGQIITSALMALSTFIVLAVAKVPNAIAFAVFAGIADVLPYIGGILAAGPAVLAALVHGPTVAIVVLAVLLAYQELENRFIIPRVYGNVLRLPSSVVIVALLAGGKLMGIIGALLALPVAAAIRLVVEELRFELPGEKPEDPSLRMRDQMEEKEYRARAEGVSATQAAEIATEIAQEHRDDDAESGR